MSGTETSPAARHLAGRLRGDVALPGDPGWDEARSAFNLLVDQQPAAVAFPLDAGDVATAVTYAREAGLRVSCQSTGHNRGPLGELDGTLLVDMRRLDAVEVDPAARTVRAGAGVKWERVSPRLSAHGLAARHGSSPDVGIAGYSLGGGIGWLGRKHGLQANAVTAIELVTADGERVRADADHDADLFWALRGGGGNFGAVTALEFGVLAVEEVYAGALFFPFERAPEVFHTWRELIAGELPDEFTSWAKLLHFPPIPNIPESVRGQSFAIVVAAYLGPEAEGRDLLEPLRALGPVRDTFATVPPVVLGDLAMDPINPIPEQSRHALLDELPAETVDALLAAIGPDSGRGSTLTLFELRQTGGALGREAEGAGALAHVPGTACAFAAGVVAVPQQLAEVEDTLAALEAALAPRRVGRLGNFVEQPADASGFYGEATWARLRAVKARHDPADLFAGNHRVPPAEAA